MTAPIKWTNSVLGRAVAAGAGRIPLLRQMQSGTRRGLVFGTIVGCALGLLLGALLGGLNRGSIGLLVGAISGSIAGMVLGGAIGAPLGLRYLPQEGQAALTLNLDRPLLQYVPGDVVSGSITARFDDTLRIGGLKLYLRCHGVYAYDRVGEGGGLPDFVRHTHEYVLLQQEVLPAGVMRCGQNPQFPLCFDLPMDALPTYKGLVCSVAWMLYAVLEVPHLPTIKAEKEVTVSTLWPDLTPPSDGYKTSAPLQSGQVIMVLPRVVYAEGEQVEGRIQIIAKEDLGVEQVRAVLWRMESVPLGDDHYLLVNKWDQAHDSLRGQRFEGGTGTTYVWIEDEKILQQGMVLRETETVSYAFALQIPANCHPTFTTAEGRASWQVAAVLSRPDSDDVYASRQVLIQTEAAPA